MRPPAEDSSRRRVLQAGLSLAAMSVPGAPRAQTADAPSERRYTVVIDGAEGGAMVVRRLADGSVRTDFSYRDNGRGPDLVETHRTDASGALVDYTCTGRTEFGAPVDERFVRDGEQARWTSSVDRGQVGIATPASYLPVTGTPDWEARMALAAWAQPGHTLALLPSGRLRVERLDGVALDTPQGRVEAGLYAMVGITLQPNWLWLQEGAAPSLLGWVSDGWSVLPAGLEAQAPVLLARQRAATQAHHRTQARRLAQPLPGVTMIRAVRWFDADAARLRGPSDVFLYEGRISAIAPPGDVPAQVARWVDGTGRTLLPGLWDMHAHLGPGDGLLHLAAGVTSVRDVGNDLDGLRHLIARIGAGDEVGPRVVRNGFIEGRSPYSSSAGRLVGSREEAVAAVDAYWREGVKQLKLYNSIRPEWVPTIVAQARRRGLRVGGHVPAFMRAEEAVRAGYDELHHINQVILNFLVKPGDDTRTLLRFTLVGDNAHRLDLDSPRVRNFIRLLRERGTVVDPTAATFESMFRQRNGQPNPTFDGIEDHLPAGLRRSLRAAEMDIDDGNAARFQASFDRQLQLVGRLHRAGVPLVAGTDAWPGFSLRRELALYVQAGIPAAEVLRIATRNAARIAGEGADRGTIARGRRADLLLVDGDPVADIGALQRAQWVVQGDRAYDSAALLDEMGIRPFTAPVRIEPGPAGGNAAPQ
jgi:hypothetical protein